jgi:hypothetical protein
MCPATIQFDDQALRGPEAIGLDFESTQVEDRVEAGWRQLALGKQSRKPDLKPTAGPAARTATETAQAGSDRRRPSSSGVPFQQGFEIPQPKPMKVFRLANCPFQAFIRAFQGDVEEGSSERRDRNPPPRCHLVGHESQVTSSDCGSRSCEVRRRDVDPAALRHSPDTPEFGRRPVAQNGTFADCQHGGEPPALARHHPVAEGIHPSLQSMEPATAQPGIDRIFPKAELDQLGP